MWYNQLFPRHDHHGRLKRVNWSHFARDSHLDCDLDTVEELYKVRARMLGGSKNIKLNARP